MGKSTEIVAGEDEEELLLLNVVEEDEDEELLLLNVVSASFMTHENAGIDQCCFAHVILAGQPFGLRQLSSPVLSQKTRFQRNCDFLDFCSAFPQLSLSFCSAFVQTFFSVASAIFSDWYQQTSVQAVLCMCF